MHPQVPKCIYYVTVLSKSKRKESNLVIFKMKESRSFQGPILSPCFVPNVSPVLLPSHDMFEVERLISQRLGSDSRHITI